MSYRERLKKSIKLLRIAGYYADERWIRNAGIIKKSGDIFILYSLISKDEFEITDYAGRWEIKKYMKDEEGR
jgi:hypothetical protein